MSKIPAPKKPQSAYFLFQNSVRAEVKAEIEKSQQENQTDDNEKKPSMIGLIAKAIGQRWGEMTDDDKKPFQKQYEASKLEYAKKLEEWEALPDDQKEFKADKKRKGGAKNEKSKKKKDPNAPKAASSAWMLFLAENREKKVDIQPKELMKLMSIEWKGMSDAQKKKYVDMAAKDKLRYQAEKEKYDAKQ
mmetsp:Transcript_21745/g.37073  ORF Transcript_21745/g.37073 Transcript_21745/m.37073 type:complete len:190 (+) Transcript_21745:92-661(+)